MKKLLLFCLLLTFSLTYAQTLVETVNLPAGTFYTQGYGLVFSNGKYWISSGSSTTGKGIIYAVNSAGVQIDMLDFDLNWIRESQGLACDGTDFWYVERKTARCDLYKVSNTGTVIDSIPTAEIFGGSTNIYLGGAAWDGSGLWISVYSPDARVALYKVNVVARTIVDTISVIGLQPQGITVKGDTLFYVMDGFQGDDEKIYAVDLNTENILFSFHVPETPGVKQNPRGLAWDGTYFWLLAEPVQASSGRQLFKYSVELLPLPTWSNQISIEDGGGTESSQILTFGQQIDATDSIDALLGEYELPPAPLTSIFDARFNLPTNPIVSSLMDFRDSSVTEITWELQFQPGSGGYPMTFSWDSTAFPEGTFFLKDRINGSFVNINMKFKSSYILTDSNITSLNIIFDRAGTNPTAPFAPNNLTAIADNYSVTLNWADNSDNETGFVIERKDGDSTGVNAFIKIDTVATDETAYINIGLTPNTTYTYRVFAFNDYYISGYSNLAQITTPALPATFQLTVSLLAGWNMVSIPGLHPVNQDVTTWWSGKDPSANVYIYSGSYQSVTTVQPKAGYWMKNLSDQTYSTGDEWPSSGIIIIPHDAIFANQGWNIIGGYEYNAAVSGITTTPPGLQNSPVYKYSGGYQMADYIIPGYGYWIKLSDNGLINLPSPLFKGSSEITDYIKEDWGKITIIDADGRSYSLYAVKDKVDLSLYELPPAPPTGMFDIRYNSNRIAEDINSSVKTIEMSGVIYPLTVRVEGMDIRLMDETGKTVNVNLRSGEDVIISDATIQKLMVSEELIPEEYALEQNYPNPFNPSTVIGFSLPEYVSNVKLSIYNALGEKVAELVNTSLTAGKYQYQWNAQNVATGMYIYELRTDKFVSVKKMVLMK